MLEKLAFADSPDVYLASQASDKRHVTEMAGESRRRKATALTANQRDERIARFGKIEGVFGTGTSGRATRKGGRGG